MGRADHKLAIAVSFDINVPPAKSSAAQPAVSSDHLISSANHLTGSEGGEGVGVIEFGPNKLSPDSSDPRR